jgi:ABC-type multidrug transport system fused ATPase/permease subunit
VQHLFSEQFGTSLIATLGVVIQDKSIRLAPGQGGNEAGIIGGDVIRQFFYLMQIGYVPSSLSSLVAGFIMLIFYTGWQGFMGYAFMSIVSYLCFWLSEKSKEKMGLYSKACDKRLSLMKQLINGIKAVKFSAWEENFQDRLDSARAEECEYIRTYRQLAVASSCLGRASPILAAAISFAAIGYTEDSVDPANIYAALSVFLALRMPMILLPVNFDVFLKITNCGHKHLWKY